MTVILRYPDGVSTIETDDEIALIQYFINWIFLTNHFSKHVKRENEVIFTFPCSSYVVLCNIKWRKLCNNSN